MKDNNEPGVVLADRGIDRRTLERMGRYRHYFAEPENGQGCTLIATLRMRGGEIAWAEQFVIRDPHGAKAYEALDRNEWRIPHYFRSPRCHQVTEAFKVINGSFRYIEMTLMEVPYGSRQVIPQRAPTVRLTYAPTRPPAKPLPAGLVLDLATIDNPGAGGRVPYGQGTGWTA